MTLNPLKGRISIPAVVALTFMATLPGCFTGIESTPKITQADVKRNTRADRDPETSRRLLADAVPEPFGHWKPGKRLIVTDSRIARALTPASQAMELSQGDVLLYEGMGKALTVMGDTVTELHFTPAHTSRRLTYRTQLTEQALLRAEGVYVPFTVEESMVSNASRSLTGRRVWIMVTRWYETDGVTPADRLKYVPVTITSVEPGSADFPLKVIFTPEADASKSYSMQLSDGMSHTGSRTFSSLFSMSDPRRQHPDISDATWRNITAGKVAVDMTRDECRLALGAPAEVETSAGVSNVVERWTYPNGVFLIFENGLLTRFRL